MANERDLAHACPRSSPFSFSSSSPAAATASASCTSLSVQPNFQPPPQTEKALLKEAAKLGLLFGKNATADTPRKKLLNAIYESKKIKRPIAYASILVVGSTGVGKSSTIKFLFNIDQTENSNESDDVSGSDDENDDYVGKTGSGFLIATNPSESETRTIAEYLLTSSDKDYEVSDIKLGITDSPGSNDTAGQKQDACNMYAIKTFYETHPSFKGEKVHANLLFLMIQASDNRFSGATSHLVKSIKYLKKLKLVDFENPNVVGIITHAAYLGTTRKEWVRNFEEKKIKFQAVINEHFHFVADVVAIENFPSTKKLQKKGYGYLLPDLKTQIPANLFRACDKLLRKNGDLFGHLAFTASFKQENLSPQPGHSVTSKNAKTETLSTEEKEFFDFCQKIAAGESVDEELVSKVREFCFQNGCSDEELRRLKCVGESLERFWCLSDLQNISTNQVSHQAGIRLDDETIKLLEFLGVKKSEPNNSHNNILKLGYGFNLITNKTTPHRIFEYELRDTEFGVLIPGPATFQLVNKTKHIMNSFHSFEERMNFRLQHLGIYLTVNRNIFQNQGGQYGRHDYSSESLYFFLNEHRVFKATIEDLDEADLTDHFTNSVKCLPEKMTELEPFEMFFNKWGHFVITEAYGGGNIEFTKKSKCQTSESNNDQNLFLIFSKFFAGRAVNIQNQNNFGHNCDGANVSSNELESCHVEWSGGETGLHSKGTVFDPEKLNKWILSLSEKPAMLTTEMRLVPISELVGKVDPDKEYVCYGALKQVLGGSAAMRERQLQREFEAIEAQTRDEEVENARAEDKDNSCFPGDTLVTRRYSGKESVITMKKLKTGDQVKAFDIRTGCAIFSPVILFAHYEPHKHAKFREILLTNGNTLTISENHLIFANTEKESKLVVDLRPGDLLFTGSECNIEQKGQPRAKSTPNSYATEERSNGVSISKINDVIKEGYFCPITENGTIIVNNIRCSCYASCKAFLGLDAHFLAHKWLLPIRLFGGKKKQKELDAEMERTAMHRYVKFLEKISRPLPFRY